MKNPESRNPFRREPSPFRRAPLPGTWEDRDVKISERQDHENGFAITVCDGRMHRTYTGGAWDTFVKAEPCNKECASWLEDKAIGILDDIPNFKESWLSRE